MTLRLIINSDDYGRSAEISRGIRESHLRGVVSSTTCMMNQVTVEDDLAIALKETPRLGLGVHLVLTSGRPVLPAAEVPGLVAEGGEFHKLDALIARLDSMPVEQVKREWHAQVEKFIRVTGRKPTHLDSHHHSSYFTEPLMRAMLELARQYGIGIRLATYIGDGDTMAGLPPETVQAAREYAPRLLAEFNPPTTDGFYASFYDQLATTEEMLRIIHSLPSSGTFEVMCHPGYADADLLTGSVYSKQREVELAILTRYEIKLAIQRRGIQLTTFADI